MDVPMQQDEAGPRSSPVSDFIEALQKISEASGPFSRDPAEHARNVLRDMQHTAVLVLRKHGITPRREDDVIDGEPIKEPR